jgi:hypothetical protein
LTSKRTYYAWFCDRDRRIKVHTSPRGDCVSIRARTSSEAQDAAKGIFSREVEYYRWDNVDHEYALAAYGEED